MSQKPSNQFDKKVSSFLTQAQAINDEKAAIKAAEAAKRQSATEKAEAEAEAEAEASKNPLATSQLNEQPTKKQETNASQGSRSSCVKSQPTQKNTDSDDKDKDKDGSGNPSTKPPDGKTFSWAMDLVRQHAEREHGSQ
ncbi:MAG: hypothetical protein Q9221_003461 [Calogaya cf. arnoldii]